MDLGQIVAWINAHAPAPVLLVLGFLGLLVVVGTAVIGMTPSKNDDAFLAKLYDVPVLGLLLKLLAAFSPLDKKAGKVVLSNGDEEPKK